MTVISNIEQIIQNNCELVHVKELVLVIKFYSLKHNAIALRKCFVKLVLKYFQMYMPITYSEILLFYTPSVVSSLAVTTSFKRSHAFKDKINRLEIFHKSLRRSNG